MALFNLGFNLCNSRMWKERDLQSSPHTSHCLSQLVTLSITSSQASIVASQSRNVIYIRPAAMGEGSEMFGAVPYYHACSPTRTDNPLEFGNSPEPCRGGGVLREPEWEAHIVHRRTPPAPARRHNSQGHGELGQRTSKPPTGRAGWEKKKRQSFQRVSLDESSQKTCC